MRTLTLFLALAATGLSIACLRLSHQLETQRVKFDAVTAELDVLRTRSVRNPFSAIEQPSVEMSSQRMPALSNAAAVSDKKPSSRVESTQESKPQEGAVQGKAAASWEEADRRMQADPKVGQLLETTTKVALRANNPELGRYLDLDPTQEDALLRVLARQELERQRMLRKHRTQREFDQVRQATSKQELAQEEELLAHLGVERYQRFQSYQEKVPELLQIQELRNRTGKMEALTDYQSSSLVAALNEERQRYLEELRRETWFGGVDGAYPVVVQINPSELADAVSAAERKIELSQAFYSRAQDRAATILTPAQKERFDQMVEEWVTQEQLRLEWLRARNEVQGSESGHP